jgi:ligand-binding sensor domain-containing protein
MLAIPKSYSRLYGHWTHFTSANSPLPEGAGTIDFAVDGQDRVWMSVTASRRAPWKSPWGSVGVTFESVRYGIFVTDGIDWSSYQLGERGLPDVDIQHLAAERTGRIWVYMFDIGFCRFDGHSTEVYRYGSPGLPEEEVGIVAALHVDAADNVWAASIGFGVYRFTDDRWEKVTSAKAGILGNFVKAICSDYEGRVCLAVEDVDHTRFVRSDQQQWELVCSVPVSGQKQEDEITCFAIDESERIWTGRRCGGLMSFQGGSWYQYTEKDCPLLYGEIRSITIDEIGNVWVGTGSGFAIFDGQAWHSWGVMYPSTSHGPISREALLAEPSTSEKPYVYIGSYMAIDSKGRKWVSTPTGIALFVPEPM